MSIIADDFVLRLSGGSSNNVGNAALGGAKSSNEASSSVDGLFDAVSAAIPASADPTNPRRETSFMVQLYAHPTRNSSVKLRLPCQPGEWPVRRALVGASTSLQER